ncbi:MAG: DUF2341 domain-containing protein, partial [Verrucomicrobia bacterium]|nr:DUF2341 domain-containing protein [Verrucomicrobiota bacterium]
MICRLTLGVMLFLVGLGSASAQYQGWLYSGSMVLLTTPEGADLAGAAEERHFPLLVRLHKEWFDFSQAKADGGDIRFAWKDQPLAYQIEEWNAAEGQARLWVLIPTIKGNDRQELKVYWGKPDALSESSGSAVFNASSGYVTVMHMDAALTDELGTLTPTNAGTTASAGIIGESRHFDKGKGIKGGSHVTQYPFSDDPFTLEGWFRAEPEAAGSHMLYYGRYANRYNGKTGDGNEVTISIASPPSLGWASDGPGGAHATNALVLGSWTHVAATYEDGTSRIYVDGRLAGSRYQKAAMSVQPDVCMDLGGLRGGYYSFAGDIDEVRVSKVARSADWMKLQYENQKPRQTLVGSLIRPGADFSVSETRIELLEGRHITVTARAGGAQKVYWLLEKEGVESVVATDRFEYTLQAGRITADTVCTLRFKAIYPSESKVINIPVTLKEDIPEPLFTVEAPAKWDGRRSIEVVPRINNLAAMQAKGAGDLKYAWQVSDIAVIKDIAPGVLRLRRAQNSGQMRITLSINNGGAAGIATCLVQVREPARDPWVMRSSGEDEKPEDNQFYARDDKNEGTLCYNGTAPDGAKAVFLKLYADGKRVKTQKQSPGEDRRYAFTLKLKPGLIAYSVAFGTLDGGGEALLHSVTNLVCGDAYIIQGQSNAEATGPNNGTPLESDYYTSEWIRSYGNYMGGLKGGWGTAVRTHKWGNPHYGEHQVGTWGMVLASNLLAKYSMPICIMNGAVGGTRIDQHQRNDVDPEDPATIYGRLLTRIQAAGLTHGIRGVLWHQGENNSGSASPTGDYDYKSYHQYFVDLSAAWKQDYPNIQNYYVFQVWPLPCSMGPKDDELREAQRSLPVLFSTLRVMSTLGIVGAG